MYCTQQQHTVISTQLTNDKLLAQTTSVIGNGHTNYRELPTTTENYRQKLTIYQFTDNY